MSNLEQEIRRILEERFVETPEFFIAEVQVIGNKTINVFIDTDAGITIGECRTISRFLEHTLEERKLVGEEYTLEVSSPGVDRPLRLPRQFHKNIERDLQVETITGEKYAGELTSVTETGIVLTREEKVKIENRKKKELQIINIEIPFEQIKTAIVELIF